MKKKCKKKLFSVIRLGRRKEGKSDKENYQTERRKHKIVRLWRTKQRETAFEAEVVP